MKKILMVLCFILCVVAMISYSANTPLKASATYRVVVDSGKVYKCDSVTWKRYDTLIPSPKTVWDTLHHKKLDTLYKK